jgi:hypothetical protein
MQRATSEHVLIQRITPAAEKFEETDSLGKNRAYNLDFESRRRQKWVATTIFRASGTGIDRKFFYSQRKAGRMEATRRPAPEPSVAVCPVLSRKTPTHGLLFITAHTLR